MDYYKPLIAGNTYHITARAIGSEKLFLNDDNYNFFLQRYDKYITPIAETFAWALLPNHFHLLVQIKPHEDLQQLYSTKNPHKKITDGWQPAFVMQCFSNLFNSYAKAFNKQQNRKGGLFMDYMRRAAVTSDAQYTATVYYIHKNPVHHGYFTQIDAWPWSSYKTMLTQAPAKMQPNKILEWFGGTDKFIEYHAQPIHLKNAVVVEHENL